jgi:hypothetical protein
MRNGLYKRAGESSVESSLRKAATPVKQAAWKESNGMESKASTRVRAESIQCGDGFGS